MPREPQAVHAEPRLALVIGNSQYRVGKSLANPANDAKLVAATLRGLGFEVTEGLDLDQKALKRAVQELGARLDRAGENAVGLFYYAGHGLQARGRNYLVPVDADIRSERDIAIEAVSADDVLAALPSAERRLNLVILDACRDNPFRQRFRNLGRALAVNGPWRITFAWEGEDAFRVDLEQYH